MMGTPRTLTTDEGKKLLYQLHGFNTGDGRKPRKTRNYCMALLMLDAGLRVGEVVQLSIDDLYFLNEARYQLRVRKDIAKNHKERIIPLSKQLRLAIETMQVRWWSEAPENLGQYAFTTWKTDNPLSTRQVERIIQKAAMKCLGRPVHPHVLRHTFASRLMRTTSVRIVQELLGHKHISTTQIYTHPNQEDLKNAIQSLDLNHSNNEVAES